MRHKKILLLTFVIALAAATVLIAQDTTTTTGKVTNVNTSEGKIAVTTAAGASETFSTDSQSMYMSGGRTVTLSTLKVGDQVTITFRDLNGSKTATHVDVVSTGSTTTTGDMYNTKPRDTMDPDAPSAAPLPSDAAAIDRDPNAYESDTMNTDDALPRTASPLPLIGLAAALFGATALGIAGMRRLAA